MISKILALGLAAWCVSAQGAELIPIEDFARAEKFRDMALSPDGDYVGFIREYEGVNRMCVTDVATMKLEMFDLGEGSGALDLPPDVHRFDWISPKRIVLRTVAGWAAVDRDRNNRKPLSGMLAINNNRMFSGRGFNPSEIVFNFRDDRWVLVTSEPYDIALELLQYPDIIKLDTRSGTGSTIVKNPGDVVHWAADHKGVVRIGIASDTEKNIESVIYRDHADDKWRTVASFEGELGLVPICFTEDGKRVYIETRPKRGMGGVYVFDPEKKELGEQVWSDPVYEANGMVLEQGTERLVGVRYFAEAGQTKWLDEKYAALQAAADAALPGKVNALRSFSWDGKRMLVESSTDRAPTEAYLYDAESGQLRLIGKSRDWIKPEQMAETFPITYAARDGLKIHGYLTVPQGMKPKHLPLVVMPHGQPHVSRSFWRFDPLVQMLANRGYAVLQMNCRGSTGYGQEFKLKGNHEVGGKIQDDIEDATRWAITKKIADPKRIAIVGSSRFGGYSAMFALGKSPGLYCCGISIQGESDWLEQGRNLNPKLDQSKKFWRDLVGDPKKDKDRLKEISPVNFADKITAPVLIVERDFMFEKYTLGRAKKMASALKAGGNKPETLFVPETWDVLWREKDRITVYKAVEAFLAKHLGGAGKN